MAAGGLVGTALGARYGWPRIARPAPPDGPLSSQAKTVLAEAWQGLEPRRVIDCHVHVIGLGTGDSGCWVSPHMRDWRNPLRYARFDIYRRAAGIDDLARADQQYAEGLVALAQQYPPHGRLLALAFDHAHGEDGAADLEASEFFVPNDYVLALARKHPRVLLPCASIHPYRRDALDELERVAAAGARCVKWLPSAMRIDPASKRCDAFYRKLAELRIPLLTHAGEERAVEVEEAQKLCNPLRLRRPLDLGVDVIVCHCASSGQGEDLDAPGKRANNFDLFLRMMDDPRHADRLWGDISAMTQFNRCERPLRVMLERTDLHPRLINGSDYPLPAINALLRTGKLESLGYIDAERRAWLDELDRHNPLVFDFALKRSVRGPKGERFADSVFMPPERLFGTAPA